MKKEKLYTNLGAVVDRAAREIMENQDIIFDNALFAQAISSFSESIWKSPIIDQKVDVEVIELSLKDEVKNIVLERIIAELESDASKLKDMVSQHYKAMLLLELVNEDYEDFLMRIKQSKKDE